MCSWKPSGDLVPSELSIRNGRAAKKSALDRRSGRQSAQTERRTEQVHPPRPVPWRPAQPDQSQRAALRPQPYARPRRGRNPQLVLPTGRSPKVSRSVCRHRPRENPRYIFGRRKCLAPPAPRGDDRKRLGLQHPSPHLWRIRSCRAVVRHLEDRGPSPRPRSFTDDRGPAALFKIGTQEHGRARTLDPQGDRQLVGRRWLYTPWGHLLRRDQAGDGAEWCDRRANGLRRSS